jgi:hypothetical protein
VVDFTFNVKFFQFDSPSLSNEQKQFLPIFTTDLGSVSSTIDLQPSNVLAPRDVNVSGRKAVTIDEQPKNAESGSDVRLSGMVMLLILVQFRKQLEPIALTP